MLDPTLFSDSIDNFPIEWSQIQPQTFVEFFYSYYWTFHAVNNEEGEIDYYYYLSSDESMVIFYLSDIDFYYSFNALTTYSTNEVSSSMENF